MMNVNATKNLKHRISIASICANVNAKYDNDKMNPFMSDRSECKWFVGPDIHANIGLPQSSTHLTQGETTLVP